MRFPIYELLKTNKLVEDLYVWFIVSPRVYKYCLYQQNGCS